MSSKKELFDWSNFNSAIVLIFITSVSTFYFYLSVNNKIAGLIADDAVYLLMADYFSPYYNSLSESAAFIMETSQFPPLYPILLAAFGASSENLVLAHLITTSCLIGAAIVYVLWVCEDKVNKNTGLCLALIFLCSPASLLMDIDLWSEHLYLLVSMCSLFFAEKAKNKKQYWLIAALFIGLLPVVRLVGITFVASFILYLFLHRVPNKAKYIVISIFPYILWEVISLNLYSSGIYQETLSDFYQYDAWLHIKHLFLSQVPDLWAGWHECFDIQKNIFSGTVAAITLILSFVTWFSRLLKKRLDSLYLLFYLILITIWPDPNHNMRFMFVVLPVMLYYSYLSLSVLFEIDALKNLKRIISSAFIFIIMITFLPTNLYAINRTFAKMPAELESYRITKYLLSVKYNTDAENTIRILKRMAYSYKEASHYIPEGQCVYVAHQEQFMYYARRLAFSLPLPKEITGDSIFQYLGDCEYIHVMYTNSHPEYAGGYPINELENKFDYLMTTQMSEDADSLAVASLIKLH